MNQVNQDNLLLKVTDLKVTSRIGGGQRSVVKGINLEVGAGETVGIVGESGSGKSMTARAIVGLLPAGLQAQGTVEYRGRQVLGLPEHELTAIRGPEIAMIFQDPFTMLNPLMRAGKQIVEQMRDPEGRRLSRAAQRAEAISRLAEVGIDDQDVVDAFPFQLSGGMRQRVGIAAALAREPQLVIADEPSTALDTTTQKEILAGLLELQRSRGMGLILITHDLRVAFSMCNRIEVLYAGSMTERGPAAAVNESPQHPYTLGLLLSEPSVDRRTDKLEAIAGSVPDPDDVAGHCSFADRCEWCQSDCCAAEPQLQPCGQGRETACVRQPEIAPALLERRARQASAGIVKQPTGEVTTEQTPGPDGALVTVRGLSKTFGRRQGRTVLALDNVSIGIGFGESVGIVGESGSGKTTLGRCLLGLERSDAGSVLIDGRDVSNFSRLSRGERRAVLGAVQMVFQDPYSSLNPVRTVASTLGEALLKAPGGSGRTGQRVKDLLRLVGLPEDYAGRKPVALSGGERQRVALARALAVQPKLIVCDEPVSALDVSVQAQILNLLTALRHELGISYLFITHDLAVVRQIADRSYVMQHGRVVEAGPTDQLLDQPTDPYTQQLVASVPRGDRAWLTEQGGPSGAQRK